MGSKRDNQSFMDRFVLRIASSAVSSVCNFFQQIILARLFGSHSFGLFGFAQSQFSDYLNGLEAGFSSAFMTRISSERKIVKISVFFLSLFLMLLLCFFLLCLKLFPQNSPIGQRIWGGLSRSELISGIIFAFIYYASMRISSVADALGITKTSEIVKIYRATIVTIIFLGCFVFGLEIRVHTALNLLSLSFLLSAMVVFLKLRPHFFEEQCGFEFVWPELGRYLKFMSPLALGIAISAGSVAYQRSLVQSFGGFAEQAYFTLGKYVAIGCLIFSAALTPLLQREVAKSISEGSLELTAQVFVRAIKGIHLLSAFTLSFLAVNAGDVVLLILGGDFIQSAGILSIMFLFPIHQTIGQLTGATILGASKTKIYSVLTLAGSLLTALLSFYFVPRAHLAGFPTVTPAFTASIINFVVQYFSVLVSLKICLNLLNISERGWIIDDSKVLISAILVSFFSRFLASYVVQGLGTGNILFRLCSSAFIYGILVFILLRLAPKVLLPKSFELADVIRFISALRYSTIKV